MIEEKLMREREAKMKERESASVNEVCDELTSFKISSVDPSHVLR